MQLAARLGGRAAELPRSGAKRLGLSSLAAFCLAAVSGGAVGCIVREPPPASEVRAAGPPPVSTRYARITHDEWARSVAQLFQIDAATVAEGLRDDPRAHGFVFDNYAATLSVDDALWRGYQAAAVEVARRVTADPGSVTQRVGGGSAAEVRRFVARVGARAHRRPLSADEVETYLNVFEVGRDAYSDREPVAGGLRLVIEALLQSPHFIYRSAGSAGREGHSLKLDAYELSARLAASLWHSLPDDELLELSESGRLVEPQVLEAQARRLLADERARAAVAGFHAELFELGRVAEVDPSSERFPHLSAGFARSAARERELFVEHQVFAKGAGYADLLTSRETFVNAELARVYEVAGSFEAERFVPVQLDENERAGLLTQVAFLASHATSTDPDPIHRGVFVARRVLCQNLTAPNSVPPLPESKGQTNRQLVESHTEKPGSACAACHARTINPLGFPFEVYDAVGRRRSEDAGFPVDASARPRVDGAEVPVADGVELSRRLAESSLAHACYVRRWLEYLHGRPSTPRDAAAIERLASESRAGRLGVRDLIVELLMAPSFRRLDARDL